MRINVPKKIKEDLELIESVHVEMDDTTQPGAGTIKVQVSKLHFEKMEFVNIFDHQWQNCSFVQYRLKYLDGSEKILDFDNKERSCYLPIFDEKGFKSTQSRDSSNWSEALPGKYVKYSAFKYLNTDLLPLEYKSFQESWEIRFDSAGILSLEDAAVSCNGIVYSEGFSKRHHDISRFGTNRLLAADAFEQKLYEDMGLINACASTDFEYLPGRTLNLFALFSNNNFCHGLLDVATMLDVLQNAKEKVRDYDYYIVPQNSALLIKSMLKFVGVDFNKSKYTGKVRETNKLNPGYVCDNLVTPSVSFFGRFYRPGSFDFLRSLFLTHEKSKLTRKLYISREGNGRDILNKNQVENLLEKLGFEIVYASKQLDLPELFSKAKIVIGAHGAAMANCVFCSPGAVLVDLLPNVYAHPFFMSLAQSVDVRYVGVICSTSSIEPPDNNKKAPFANTHMQVNIPQLKKLLDELM